MIDIQSNAHVDAFLSQITFRPEWTGYISCEREFFITEDGVIVPRAHEIIPAINQPDVFTNELSDCQFEYNAGPVTIDKLREAIIEREEACRRYEEEHGFKLASIEVAPENMSRDIYPAKRYEGISERVPADVLLGMLRIAGTHFHVGVSGPEMALRVYNSLVRKLSRFNMLGDNSNGERLRIYRDIVPVWEPVECASLEEYASLLVVDGEIIALGDDYRLVKITHHGTVEVRGFGAPEDLDELTSWGREVHDGCLEVM